MTAIATIYAVVIGTLIVLGAYAPARAGALLLARDLEAAVNAIRQLRHRSSS